MDIFVIDGQFHTHDPHGFDFVALDDASTAGSNHGIDLPNTIDPEDLPTALLNAPAFRIPFPSSADGRGNSIAAGLRQRGYRGHLRASGHVLADQYPLALRSGFNDVEIESELAERQPQHQWLEAEGRIAFSYRDRLQRGAPRAA